MNFLLKWWRLLSFIIKILQFLDKQNKQKIGLLDKTGKEKLAKKVADTINKQK